MERSERVRKYAAGRAVTGGKERKMKRTSAKIVCGVLAAAITAAGLSGCGDSTVVDGTKTALVINDEKINLGKANFMLRYQQATMANYYQSMSSMFGQQYSLSFDEPSDQNDEDSPTVGENLKEDALSSIEKAFLLRQHASEYDVELTDEEKQGASDAAAAFVENNDADILTKLGVTQEDIQDLAEVYAIQTKMYNPMVADVDTDVTDDEAKQSKISYAKVSTEGTETDENGETVELTDEEKAEKKEIAQRFLDELNASADPASVDFSDLKDQVNDELNAENKTEEGNDETASDDSADAASSSDTSSGETDDTDVVYVTASQTTFGADDENLDQALKDAAADLTDGQIDSEVIEGEDGYYVLRMDSVLDREATDSQKQTIVEQRQNDAYNDKLDEWVKESDISVKRAWKKLEVTDYDLYTMTVDSSEDTSDSSSAETDASDSSSSQTDSTDDTSDGTVNTDSAAGE